jgi:outer membrane protein assembly factor BamB
MRFFKSPRLFTLLLMVLCLALIGIAAAFARGNVSVMLRLMGSQVIPNLLLLAFSLTLVTWGAWTVLGSKENPTTPRSWAWMRLVFGILCAALSVGAFVVNPSQLQLLYQQDYSDTGRAAALSDKDLQAVSTTDSKDWPQWLGPNRDGRSTETGLNTDWKGKHPKELWRKPLGGGYSSMAVLDGKLYTMDLQGSNERVVCLDTATGNELWSHSYPVNYSMLRAGYAEGPRATPTLHEGRIYTVGATGIFLCLELPAAGQKPTVKWQHDLMAQFSANVPTWGVACSSLIEKDMVIVQPGGSQGSVVAFDRLTGEVKWKALSDKPGYSSPVAATLAGVRQIICFTGENIVGLQASTGDKLWSYPWSTMYDCNAATPIVFGKYVFISSGYNTGCALLEIQGESLAEIKAVPVHVRPRKLMRNHHSNCVLHEGHLFGFDENVLRCINVRTFEEAWSSRNPGKGCLIFADGHLVILTEQGTLALIEASPKGYVSKGQFEVFSISQTWAFPTVAQGKLYLRSNREIVCRDLHK